MADSIVAGTATEAGPVPQLSVADVSAGYGTGIVVRDVSLEVGPAQVVSVIGPNGGGKTTLLRAISGMIATVRGEVRVAGRSCSRRPAHAVSRLGIAHAPEGRCLFSSMTVFDNLVLGTYALDRRRRRRAYTDSLAQVLEAFPVLEEKLHVPAGSLSGGQQQMVAIGRALMSQPKVILLDEPSMGLAPIAVRAAMESIRRLTMTGVGVLLVEQVVDVALQISDWSYVLRRGEIVLSGPSAELQSRRDAVNAAYFGTDETS